MSHRSLFTFDQHGGASVPSAQPDICERKHGGNAESAAAHAQAARHIGRDQGEILAWLGSVEDGTAKEYAKIAGREFNTISGRFSELKKLMRIVPTGLKRDGCAVYRVGKG